jgi:CRISPR-associated exonuclease Cas4
MPGSERPKYPFRVSRGEKEALSYTEDDLLPISALQHLAFCPRQWALIHLEGAWADNRLTAEGIVMHERAHDDEAESRGDLRISRGLRLRSLRLGLVGQADVVEFHKTDNPNEGIKLDGAQVAPRAGAWIETRQGCRQPAILW